MINEQAMKKTVGIITMHQVLNCGSAIQAYALQRVIELFGFQTEIIDYKYPNKYHKSIRKKIGVFAHFTDKCYTYVAQLYLKQLFKPFYKRFYHLSKPKYNDIKSIKKHPPKYDIYISGSDQVWNPTYIGNDTNFMLDFIDSPNKVAYAGSIANDIIQNRDLDQYVLAWKKYRALSVREEQSARFLSDLCNKKVQFVLDPSLLLTHNDWNQIKSMATVKYDKSYILVYILGYSFPVYDYANLLIDDVARKTGLDVVLFIYSRSHRRKLSFPYKSISKVSPPNFVYLINNASLVITDSFHATAMSINFSRPLYPLIKSKENTDNRIFSLLCSLGIEDWAVEKDTQLNKLPSLNHDYSYVQEKLNDLRKSSMDYIKNNLILK